MLDDTGASGARRRLDMEWPARFAAAGLRIESIRDINPRSAESRAVGVADRGPFPPWNRDARLTLTLDAGRSRG